MTTEPIKEPAKKTEPAKKADAYTAIADKKPAFKYNNPVSRTSGVVLLKKSNGKVFAGRVTEYISDINASHIQVKKGDLFFTDLEDGSSVDGIVSWKPIDK